MAKKKAKNKKRGIPHNDPSRLAEQFLTDYIWTPDPDNPKVEESFFKLRRWRGEFYLWINGCYVRLANDTVQQRVMAYLRLWFKGVMWSEGIHYSVTRNLASNVLANIEAIAHIKESQELNSWLDGASQDGCFLSLVNGLLRLGKDLTQPLQLKLISHTPGYFTTVKLPYDYDPNSDCPEFEKFLDEIMLGKQDFIHLLQEFIGYLFRPDLREHKFLLCVGEGANGKTTLFDVLRALIGEANCSETPISRFDDRFALYGTIGKVANLTHESSSILADEAENILKSYVSGDRMTIDRKFKDPIEVTPTAKLMISTNNLPRFTDKSQAIWRRILLVPFDLVVDEKDQVKNLAEQLKQELPGILNWALEGLDRLNQQGFTVPQGQKELMEQYRRDSDPARSFLLDKYEASLNGTYVSCKDAYKTYQQWCEANGCRQMNERTFGQHVRRIFPGIERRYVGPRGNREYVYQGLLEIL